MRRDRVCMHLHVHQTACLLLRLLLVTVGNAQRGLLKLSLRTSRHGGKTKPLLIRRLKGLYVNITDGASSVCS